MRNNTRNFQRIFIAMTIIGAVIRLISCAKYLNMDEKIIYGNILHFVKFRTIIPHYFLYPTFFSYVGLIPSVIGAYLLSFLGIISSPIEASALYNLDSILPIIPIRILSLSFSIATIWLVFRTGKKFYDESVGILAAAMLLFSPLDIERSSWGLSDNLMVLFSALAMFFCFSALKNDPLKNIIRASIMAGLATSTKYNAGMLIFPIAAVVVIHLFQIKNAGLSSGRVIKTILLPGAAFVCAFLLASPGCILAPGKFFSQFGSLHQNMVEGSLGFFGLPYIQFIILTWQSEKTLLIMFAVGIIYAGIRRNKENMVFLFLFLPSFLYIGSWERKSLNYLMFLWPSLAVISAYPISKFIRSLFQKKRIAIAGFLIAALFVWPVCSSVRYAYTQLLKDSRWVANRWIQENIPEGSKIVVDWAYVPRIIDTDQKKELLDSQLFKDFYRKRLARWPAYEKISLQYDPIWVTNIKAAFLITSSACFSRFFNTPPPRSKSPLKAEWDARKGTYELLLKNEKRAGWILLKDFYTGKGPHVLVYKRTTPADI